MFNTPPVTLDTLESVNRYLIYELTVVVTARDIDATAYRTILDLRVANDRIISLEPVDGNASPAYEIWANWTPFRNVSPRRRQWLRRPH